METREFAEQVLFANSLEMKLSREGELTDDDPGKALETPALPGRPVDLRLRRDGVRVPFPKQHQLYDEEQRGILMHFFANHELLATELMALVLLKFPDAPKAFRKGIVRTLREEQEHTRLYMDRMAECGVRFGDFPVNRFFWDNIAPMESPLDYVTRLSLTFEQANLDFSNQYSKLMYREGDDATARILERIYKDEIAHVGYGLKWFRRWKSDQETDWQAFRKQLHFPLSPSRAKANSDFNAEGRRKAGLDADFIRNLRIFSQSKGRTPHIYYFNPAVEAELASATLDKKKSLLAYELDLESLMLFAALAEDVVLLREGVRVEHQEYLANAGFQLPQMEVLVDGRIAADSELRDRKIGELRPWAVSPEAAAVLNPLGSDVWKEDYRRLFSKTNDMAIAGRLQGGDTGGVLCADLREAEEAFNRFRGLGYPDVMVKAPFGTSGSRNFKMGVDGMIEGTIAKVLQRQRQVIVEPWLNRVLEFSVQYSMQSGKLRKVAQTWVENSERGQFVSCAATMKIPSWVPTEVARFLMSGVMDIYDGELLVVLQEELESVGYEGPVGVDAMVHRDQDGGLQLRPIVEINPRYTMGRITWELFRKVSSGRDVKLKFWNARMLQAVGVDSFAHAREYFRQSQPVELDDRGVVRSGAVILNDPATARYVLAVLEVGKVRPFGMK